MKILVLGGTGYIGTAVCAALKDHDVTTFAHNGDYKGSILHADQLSLAMSGKDVVINLVGLTPLKEPKFTSYQLVHVQGVKAIIEACKTTKIKRLIHISALGASKHAPTQYLRTKGEAEELLASMKNCTILRPSVVVDFDNELVKLIMKFPLFPHIRAQIQPIIRKDLAQIVKLAALGKIKEKKLDVVGSETMSLYQLAKRIRFYSQKSLIPLPLFLVKSALWIAANLHIFSIGKDQLKNISLDNTSQDRAIDKYITPLTIEQWVKT